MFKSRKEKRFQILECIQEVTEECKDPESQEAESLLSIRALGILSEDSIGWKVTGRKWDPVTFPTLRLIFLQHFGSGEVKHVYVKGSKSQQWPSFPIVWIKRMAPFPFPVQVLSLPEGLPNVQAVRKMYACFYLLDAFLRLGITKMWKRLRPRFRIGLLQMVTALHLRGSLDGFISRRNILDECKISSNVEASRKVQASFFRHAYVGKNLYAC